MKRKYDLSSPDLHAERNGAAHKANVAIKNSPAFIKLCREVDTPVTTRQASKYLKKRGKAFNNV